MKHKLVGCALAFLITAPSAGQEAMVMQGGDDDNVLPEIQVKFAESYRRAGGDCTCEVFEGCGHIWVADPGPQTDRAHAMVKAFIARVLAGG
jgi:dipeptidyl aminopeptidase/acylaminoacyl peptidase